MDIETKLGPYIKSEDTTSKIMRRLLFALLPIIIFAVYKNGVVLYLKGYTNVYGIAYPLIFIILGMLSSLVTEEAYAYIIKGKRGKALIDDIKHSYAMFPGLFLSLVLPINTPLAILFLGGMVASLIGKLIYGGFGRNIFNPALVGALFVTTCYGIVITNNGGYLNAYEIDTLSGATPLTNVKLVSNITYDSVVATYGDITSFLTGMIPGSLGEVSSIIILVSFLYLAVTKTIKVRIPVSYVLTFAFMCTIYCYFAKVGYWFILFELLSGGLLFGAVFMATDPVTSPITVKGQILYGMALGIMTFAIRFLTGYPEGVMLSILSMNLLTWLFDKIGSRIKFNKCYYFVFVILFALACGCGYYTSTLKEDIKENKEFEVISKTDEGKNTIYEVSEKGFGGDIIAKVTFNERNVTKVDIISHSESEDRYDLIKKEKYIDKLIKNQSELDEVDTITGATISSNAIKKLIANTMNEFAKEKGLTITNPNIKIISKEQNKNAFVYVVETDSFGGKMKLQVVMIGDAIRTVIPLEYKDTCVSEQNKNEGYKCPSYMDDEYIANLIVNQDKLDEVDTVTGATISSKALKEVFIYMKEVGLNG